MNSSSVNVGSRAPNINLAQSLIKALSFFGTPKISQTTSITPKKSDGISGLVGGEYWIEANIRTENDTTKSYQTVYVESDLEKEKSSFNSSFQFPQKPIIIIMVIIVVVAVIGVIIRK